MTPLHRAIAPSSQKNRLAGQGVLRRSQHVAPAETSSGRVFTVPATPHSRPAAATVTHVFSIRKTIARCPGDCSGHGTCMTIADMSRFYGPDYAQPGTGGDGIGPAYGNWDAQSTTACYCDQGHFGADCSNRK